MQQQQQHSRLSTTTRIYVAAAAAARLLHRLRRLWLATTCSASISSLQPTERWNCHYYKGKRSVSLWQTTPRWRRITQIHRYAHEHAEQPHGCTITSKFLVAVLPCCCCCCGSSSHQFGYVQLLLMCIHCSSLCYGQHIWAVASSVAVTACTVNVFGQHCCLL